jgi:hypothetical protein
MIDEESSEYKFLSGKIPPDKDDKHPTFSGPTIVILNSSDSLIEVSILRIQQK